ncbi:MAG TPA: HAD-IIA family hydrolase [Actinomycetota bacterium]|nr:HAD-IIA family hydrolase [Actinomycetota bacterium]
MLAGRYGCILFDLDGVLYRGDEAVPGASETLATLRRTGTRLAFLTNNSSRTPEQVAAKLRSLGIAAEPAEVVTSALATAELLASRGGGSAYVIGGEGVARALADAGLRVLDDEPQHADLVVVGIDETMTYAGLKRACLLVRNGARLLATNVDPTFPAAGGELWPGAGALVAAIVTATGVEAEVVGKPFAPLFEAARRRAGGGAPLVVGDRLDTDIAGAVALGWDSMLVLTGVSGPADLDPSDVRPTFLADDVSALVGSEDAGVVQK